MNTESKNEVEVEFKDDASKLEVEEEEKLEEETVKTEGVTASKTLELLDVIQKHLDAMLGELETLGKVMLPIINDNNSSLKGFAVAARKPLSQALGYLKVAKNLRTTYDHPCIQQFIKDGRWDKMGNEERATLIMMVCFMED